jgi:hypothetical protein
MHAVLDQTAVTLQLPDPNEEILPGVHWGRFDQLFTPAFWLCRAWYEQVYPHDSFRIGDNLTEEIVACLLGGHGLPAEVGLAAFRRLKGAKRYREGDFLFCREARYGCFGG